MTLLSFDSLHLVESSVKNKGSDDGVRTWSTAVQILLPVAALAILWGRRGFFARFFLQFDKNCVSVFCPPFSKRQRLLKWASGRLPPTWSSHANTFPGGPAEFWRDGSLLCTLINSAIPGACSNPHRHWKRPPSHGQALAYKYLGVVPVFTETELSQNCFTLRHEGALVNYLLEVQEAITNISLHELKFSSRYAARGMGLVVGEQHRKTAFYIYSSSTTSSSKHDVMVSIRGPYNNHCAATIPAYYISKKHLQNHYENKKHLVFESGAQRSFFRSLSVDLGSFINVNQKPEGDENMPIKLISESERVKVVFIPNNVGIHEISIITNGFHLVGSPFNVNITENTSGVIDTFDKSLRYPYRKNTTKNIRRKIISKIIDFIDEKISYEKLKIKPLYERNIPKIKITETKDVSQENCGEEKTPADTDSSEDVTNRNAREIHQDVNNCSSTSNLNFENYGGKNDEITSNNFSKNDEKFDLLLTPEPIVGAKKSFLDNEPDTLEAFLNQDLLDANLKSQPLSNANEKAEHETVADFNSILVTSNKSSNDDFNNNTIEVDSISSSMTRDSSNQPYECSTQSTFTTSPVCLEHIEEEVNDESNASSEVPKWNFEKKQLRRQSNVDISDTLDKDEHEDGIEETVIPTGLKKNNSSVSGQLDDHKTSENYKMEDMSFDETLQLSLESDWEKPDRRTTLKAYKSVIDRLNENLKGQHSIQYKIGNQTNHNNIKFESEKENIFSGPNSLNILNFLSSLKVEDLNSENAKTFSTVKTVKQAEKANPPNLHQEKECEHRINFNQRLQYWESQTNLHISQKRRKLRLRRSLPDLLPRSGSELFVFVSPNEENENYKFQDNSDASEFKSQFKERQEYWKALSSQSIDHSSITSSMYYLETLGKLNKHRINARRSLPDIFSKVTREEVINEMSYRNLCFPIDFFDSPEAVNFKTKFKECKEFWENLSSQNLNYGGSYEYIDIDSFKHESFDDGKFDSGFYNSLPNLSLKRQNWDNSDSFDEYSDSLKFKRQYEERREYWEKLSLHSVSDLSLSSLLVTEKYNAEATYQDRNALLEIKPVMVKTSNESQQKKIKTATKSHQTIRTNLEETAERNDFDYLRRDEEETNLTDDLKHINDRREKMKIHFNQARSFFQNLEESIK